MKLAIVHDFLNQYGGAEKCVEAFHELYPNAPIFTSIYIPEIMPKSFREMEIRTSFLQHMPFKRKHFKKFLLLYPKAIESFDLSEYDLILSSSSAFAKGVRKPKDACHISYCYTPMRFVWDYENYIVKENVSPLIKKYLPRFISGLKVWDLKNNENVDFFIAISRHINKRIQQCYNRQSDVIYPPVDVDAFHVSDSIDNYFLIVSRLNAYKRIDIVINAFNRLGLPLRIVGEGLHRKILEKIAGPTIAFMGRLDERSLAEHYAHCRAFIFPGSEDFGIAPLEAQSAGRPVIAFAAGGALETVIDGHTGIYFNEQSVESLVDAVNKFVNKENEFNSTDIRNNARRFDKNQFKSAISRYVTEKYEEFRKRTKR